MPSSRDVIVVQVYGRVQDGEASRDLAQSGIERFQDQLVAGC